jgi:uncharacterized protein (DUF1501 family)
MLNRRGFIGAAAIPFFSLPAQSYAAMAASYRTLVLIELKGGNDGLNTLVPAFDQNYYSLRPTIAIPRDQLSMLNEGLGLHPSLKSLMPLWSNSRMAVLQGVGYPSPNLSHFRSIEIWDGATTSDEYATEGWITKTMRLNPVSGRLLADGVTFGSNDPGPLMASSRHLVLQKADSKVSQGMMGDHAIRRDSAGALSHIRGVDSESGKTSSILTTARLPEVRGQYPAGAFGSGMKEAAKLIIAAQRGDIPHVPVIRVVLSSFDTHQNQLGTHAGLLKQLGEGVAAFWSDIDAAGAGLKVLAMTYSEFGRRPKENGSGGTDHGTASVQFVWGDGIHAGFHGQPLNLAALDSGGNPKYQIDFRSVYSGVLEEWFGVSSKPIVGDVRRLGLFKHSVMPTPRNVA